MHAPATHPARGVTRVIEPARVATRVIDLSARVVNRALAGEDALRGKLAAHAGATFRVAGGPAHADFTIDAEGALHEAAADAVPSLTLTIRARDVPGLLADPSRFATRVHADGDAALAATLGDLAATVPWFVERLCSEIFGHVLGQRIADTGRRLLGFPESAATGLARHVQRYATEEAALGISRDAAAGFDSEARALAARVDALAARIDALAARR
jgi:ubiquinone biosynthesis protein UbiJ